SRAEECLEIVSLTDQRNSWCRELSRGQTQRLVLAKTLLPSPKVMILDEPASGLDPLSRRELRLSLQAIAREGATVFVSSHILSELAEMCSSLCVMNQGQILASGTATEVRNQLGRAERQITVTVLGPRDKIASWLARQHGVLEVTKSEQHDQRVILRFAGGDHEQAALLSGILEQGVAVKSFEEKGASFEEILVKIAEDNRRQEESPHET
ncbi:MAG TPA: ABC transporter ATP-binding protein, partial [Verrucomicrobiales bacterium]|nr:ABC transporter ATP-binding protein [Verrucomicrobiales bacterium]